jgi:uncharacterized SAM-binding protein YcdF (DUF218 family)
VIEDIIARSTIFRNLLELVRAYHEEKPHTETAEAVAVVVLGAQVLPGGWPSRTLRVRALFAARLYSEGIVSIVIPSGSVGKHPPSEAAVISDVLRNAGVPDEHVLPEERGRSTRESARLVAKLAHARGIEHVLIVTDPLHCVRAVSAFREAGISAAAAPVYDSPMWRSPVLRWGQFLREMVAIIWYRVRSLSQR